MFPAVVPIHSSYTGTSRWTTWETITAGGPCCWEGGGAALPWHPATTAKVTPRPAKDKSFIIDLLKDGRPQSGRRRNLRDLRGLCSGIATRTRLTRAPNSPGPESKKNRPPIAGGRFVHIWTICEGGGGCQGEAIRYESAEVAVAGVCASRC